MKCPFNGNFEEGHPIQEQMPDPCEKPTELTNVRRPGRLLAAIDIAPGGHGNLTPRQFAAKVVVAQRRTAEIR